jgi:galactofuranosylgalactofuranosylrhamnosyl-N-acetylglucosaminyl-diphospho-decaprenol beta-1,5/1,6-galactofuranosyltransferase
MADQSQGGDQLIAGTWPDSTSEAGDKGVTDRSSVTPLLVARGLFAGPSTLIPADMYAKVLRGAAEPERHRLVVHPHSRVSTNTYFGRVPASYWQRWTEVGEVLFELDCAGAGTVTVLASDSVGDSRPITTATVSSATARTVRLAAPIDKFVDGGALWLDITTAGEQLTVERVRVTVAPRQRLRPSAVVICTHNRVDDCLNTLAALAADPGALAYVSVVYVIDQGSDPVSDRSRFADVSASLGAKLRYIRQPNLGGSGGFTRGLFEATGPAAPPANVLFMDDDVLCEPEVVVRLTAFANLLVEPAIVGAQMLNLLHPSQLLAPAEHADLVRMLPGQMILDTKLNVDQLGTRIKDGRSNIQEKRVDAGYNGWWCCLIPIEIVDAVGYPMPFFFQWDDVEFGYRARSAGYATVTLPGAGLWHADFHWKDWDEWHRYFNMRNGLITSALQPSFDPKRAAGVLAADLVRYLLGMQYGLAATMLKAVEDFLRGPEILHDGGVAAMAEIRALRANYPETAKHPATAVPGMRPGELSEVPAGPQPSLEGIVLLKRVIYQLLGRGPRHVGTVRAGDARWWHVSLFETAVVTDMSQEGVRVRHRDRATMLRLAKQGLRVLTRLAREGAGATAAFRGARPRLTSRDNWSRLYELSAEQQRSDVAGRREH